MSNIIMNMLLGLQQMTKTTTIPSSIPEIDFFCLYDLFTLNSSPLWPFVYLLILVELLDLDKVYLKHMMHVLMQPV